MGDKKVTINAGLDALFSKAASSNSAENINDKIDETNYDLIDILSIKISKYQPRRNFQDISELAESIKQHGIIQPLLVRKLDDATFELIAGERRWRAAKSIGLTEVPVIIKNVDNEVAAAFALIENIQRDDLTALEEAQAYQKLIAEFGLTHEQVAERVGRSRSSITNMLRLLTLEEPVQELVDKALLDMGHARALLALKKRQQIETAIEIVEKALSVRQAERLVQSRKEVQPKKNLTVSPDVQKKINRWCNGFMDAWDNSVDVKVNAFGKGRIVIHVDSDLDVERLLKRLRETTDD